MTQATKSLSRRGALAGLSAAAAVGAVALPAWATEIDPIFEMIAKHAAAHEIYEKAVYAEGPLTVGPEMDAASAASSAVSGRAAKLLWDLVHTEPTTLAGVAALLDHLSQPEFKREEDSEYADCRHTHLTNMLEMGSEWKRAAEDFPGWIAETMRGLIGGSHDHRISRSAAGRLVCAPRDAD